MDQQRVFGMTPWVRRLFVANLLVFVLQETVLGPRFLAAFGFAPMTAFAHPWTAGSRGSCRSWRSRRTGR